MSYIPNQMHHFQASQFSSGNCALCGAGRGNAWHADPQYPADVQLPSRAADMEAAAAEWLESLDLQTPPCGCVPAPKVTTAIVIEAHTLERIEEIIYQHVSARLTAVRHAAHCRADTCGWVGEEWPTEGDARHEYAQHLAELIAEHAS